MMKKILFYILAIGLLLGGCGGREQPDNPTEAFSSSQVMPEYDAQNQYLTINAYSFLEREGAFLGTSIMDHYLHYYDEASGVSGVLCADPACTHDSSDCGAYVKAGATVSYYDGKLYWVATESQSGQDYYLWRGDLSGRNKEKVKPIGWDEIILTYQPQRYVVHRGRLYLLGQTEVVNGTEAGFRVSLLSTSLDGSDDFKVLYDETFSQGVQSSVRFVKDVVYLSVYAIYTIDEVINIDVTVERYDIAGDTWETVYGEKNIQESLEAVWVTEEEGIYIPGSSENRIYVWKIENGKRKEVLSRESEQASTPWISGDVVVDVSKVDNIRWIEIVDLSGQTLYKGKLFPVGVPGMEIDPNQCGLGLIGADEEKLILNLSDFVDGDMVDYTIKLDITDSLKPTILWSSQE